MVIALGRDVLELRNELKDSIDSLNEKAAHEDLIARLEIVAWCEEKELSENGYPYFYATSPAPLVQEITKEFQPDIIICVFRTLFGSRVDSDIDISEQEKIVESWSKQTSPHILIYLCEKSPIYLHQDENELRRKHLISGFKQRFYGAREMFWWVYEPNSKLKKLLETHLWEIATKEGRNKLNPLNKPSPELDLPFGWEYISPQKLAKYRDALESGGKLSVEDALAFFDGKRPTWKEAVSESIPRRLKVEKILDKIQKASYNNKLQLTLLTGASGEGKSTMLYQLAVDLTERFFEIYVIWRNISYLTNKAILDEQMIKQLLDKPQYKFVIISDEADQIAGSVYEQIININNSKPSSNIQFLLASRGTKWTWAGGKEHSWNRELSDQYFSLYPIRSFDDKDDAKKIVDAWRDVGPNGLGDLNNLEPVTDKQPKFLYDLAQEEAKSNDLEGSFFGAILEVRKNKQTLIEYIDDTLNSLKNRTVLNGKTNLRDVFAYIVALHADEVYLLHEDILCRIFSCESYELEDEILKPLADEAMIRTNPDLILARHIKIAKVAKEHLDKNNLFVKKIYPELVRAAIEDFLANRKDEEKKRKIKLWNNLHQHYLDLANDQNDHIRKTQYIDIAISIANAHIDAEPKDPNPVTRLSNLYRDIDKMKAAVEVFRDRFKHISKPDKGYFFEWSVAEGKYARQAKGKRYFGVYLSGIALSDQVPEMEHHKIPPMERLSGITTSFKNLFEQISNPQDDNYNPSHSEIFLKACAAAAQLGLDPKSLKDADGKFDEPRARRNLMKGKEIADKNNIADVAASEAINLIRQGIVKAWELDETWQRIIPLNLYAPNLTFQNLLIDVFL